MRFESIVKNQQEVTEKAMTKTKINILLSLTRGLDYKNSIGPSFQKKSVSTLGGMYCKTITAKIHDVS